MGREGNWFAKYGKGREKGKHFPKYVREQRGCVFFFVAGPIGRKEKKIPSPSLFPRLIANAKDTFDFCHFLANKTGIRIIRYIKIAFFYSVKLFSSIIFPYILLRTKGHVEICAFFCAPHNHLLRLSLRHSYRKASAFCVTYLAQEKKVSLYTYISQA